jgi:hypothetical protein
MSSDTTRYVDHIKEYDNKYYSVFYHVDKDCFVIVVLKSTIENWAGSNLEYLLGNSAKNKEATFPISVNDFLDFLHNERL